MSADGVTWTEGNGYLWVKDGGEAVIANSTIYRADYHDGSSGSVTNGTVTGYISVGASSLTIQGNAFTRTTGTSITINENSNSTISSCNFMHVPTTAIQNNGTGLINAQGNWWGDPSGPRGDCPQGCDPSHSGAYIYGNVDASNWAASIIAPLPVVSSSPGEIDAAAEVVFDIPMNVLANDYSTPRGYLSMSAGPHVEFVEVDGWTIDPDLAGSTTVGDVHYDYYPIGSTIEAVDGPITSTEPLLDIFAPYSANQSRDFQVRCKIAPEFSCEGDMRILYRSAFAADPNFLQWYRDPQTSGDEDDQQSYPAYAIPVSESSCEVTVEIDSLVIGDIVITGDSFSSGAGETYTVTGNIALNHFLKLTDTLHVDMANGSISGDGLLYTDELPQDFNGGTFPFYSGHFDAFIVGSRFFGFNELLSSGSLAGFTLRLEEFEFVNEPDLGNGVMLSATINLPSSFGDIATELYFTENIGVQLAASIEIDHIYLPGGVKLKDLYLDLDFVENAFCGGGMVRTPLLGIGGGLCLVDGCLDSFEAEVEVNAGIPLGPTSLFLIGGNVGLSNLCDSSVPVGIVAGVDISVASPGTYHVVKFDNMQLEIQPASYLGGSGTVVVFGKDYAYGSLGYSFQDGVVIAGLWNLNFLKIDLEANINWPNFNGRATAAVSLTADVFPAELKWLKTSISHLLGLPYELANAEVVVDNTVILGELTLNLGAFTQSFAARAEYIDQSLHFAVGADFAHLVPIGRQFSHSSTPNSGDLWLSERGLHCRASTVAPTPTLVFVLEGSETAVPFNLRAPNGDLIRPTDGEDPDASVYFLLDSESKTSIFYVKNPVPGEWEVEIENPGDQLYTLDRFAQGFAPSIVLSQPASTTTQTTIEWNAIDEDSDAEISLYYDADGQDFNGVLIERGISEDQSNGSFTWDVPDSLVQGTYHVYAIISDGLSAPSMSYAPGAILVERDNLIPAPGTFNVSETDTSLSLAWDYVVDPRVEGYIVHGIEANSGESFTQAAGDSNRLELSEIQAGRTYEFTVAAYDTLGIEGASTDFLLYEYISEVENNHPQISSEPTTITTAGAHYSYEVTVSDEDDDEVEYRFDDATVVPAGLEWQGDTIVWQVPADSIGLYVIGIEIDDGNGGYDAQSYTLQVVSPEEHAAMLNVPAANWIGIEDELLITVRDLDLDVDATQIDSLELQVTSPTDPAGTILVCRERDPSAGLFIGSLQFSSGSSSEQGVIQVSDQDTVVIQYQEYMPLRVHEAEVIWFAEEVADVIPPQFDIVLLQGSVLQGQLHAYIYASEPLVSEPTVLACDEELAVSSIEIAGETVYYASTLFSESAVCEIAVAGIDQSGNAGSEARGFSIGVGDERFYTSLDSLCVLDLEDGSRENRAILIQALQALEEIEPDTDLKQRAGSEQHVAVKAEDTYCASIPYKISCFEESVGSAGILRLKYQGDLSSIPDGFQPSIAAVFASQAVVLPSWIEGDGWICAEIGALGTYQVVVGRAEGPVPPPPLGAYLEPIYPNPFNPQTNVTFVVGFKQKITVRVFDVLGRHVKTLNDSVCEPGVFNISWDGMDESGRPAPSGVYLVSLFGEGEASSKKAVLIR
ncbi:MAG: T9SS type A sorting domain-containing protein [bacterium]|nr:T9SS type A sorting domain-containing protein [bacterium]